MPRPSGRCTPLRETRAARERWWARTGSKRRQPGCRRGSVVPARISAYLTVRDCGRGLTNPFRTGRCRTVRTPSDTLEQLASSLVGRFDVTDRGPDLSSGPGPAQRLGVLVPVGQVLRDRAFELAHAVEAIATNSVRRDQREPVVGHASRHARPQRQDRLRAVERLDQRPMTSASFVSKAGSRLNLKVSMRWGCGCRLRPDPSGPLDDRHPFAPRYPPRRALAVPTSKVIP